LGHFFVVWWQAMLDLLFPRTGCICCAGRGNLDKAWLCPGCRSTLESMLVNFRSCPSCAAFILKDQERCMNCLSYSEHWFDSARAVFPYDGLVKDLIWRFKYQGESFLARPLGQLMRDIVLGCLKDGAASVIVPVPLHAERLKQRGYNQSELLAREIGQYTGLPIASHVLVRVKNTPSQTGLNRKDRWANLNRAFALVPGETISGKAVLLLDDIFTTGATVDACARILKNGGAARVDVIAFAAGKFQ